MSDSLIAILNTDRSISTHYDVIYDRNSNNFSSLLQPFCGDDVLFTGSRIAAWMIMDHQDAVCRVANRRTDTSRGCTRLFLSVPNVI